MRVNPSLSPAAAVLPAVVTLAAAVLVAVPTAAVADPVAAPAVCAPGTVALPLPAGAVSGEVLGAVPGYASGDVTTAAGVQSAVLWTRGSAGWTVATLPVGTSAPGVNTRGTVIVQGPNGAWVYTGGRAHPLKDAGGRSDVTLVAINQAGLIVGNGHDPAGGFSAAVTWSSWKAAAVQLAAPAGIIDYFAEGVDGAGDVVGLTSYGTFLPMAVYWKADGSFGQLDSTGNRAEATEAFGTTTSGRTVGFAYLTTGERPAVWNGSTLLVLPQLPGDIRAQANSVSSAGLVVGVSGSFMSTLTHVLLWTGSGRVRSLLPLSGTWSDGASANVADDRGAVYGASRAVTGGPLLPTVWNCARQQSFVPPAA